MRRGPLKLVTERAKDDQPPALYNLTSDIGETQDLAAIQPADVASLTQLYAQWNLETVPSLWQKNTDSNLYPWSWRATGMASTKTIRTCPGA